MYSLFTVNGPFNTWNEPKNERVMNATNVFLQHFTKKQISNWQLFGIFHLFYFISILAWQDSYCSTILILFLSCILFMCKIASNWHFCFIGTLVDLLFELRTCSHCGIEAMLSIREITLIFPLQQGFRKPPHLNLMMLPFSISHSTQTLISSYVIFNLAL